MILLAVLLFVANCSPAGKSSPYCKLDKTVRDLIWHLLPLSVRLGGNVYSSYKNIVSWSICPRVFCHPITVVNYWSSICPSFHPSIHLFLIVDYFHYHYRKTFLMMINVTVMIAICIDIDDNNLMYNFKVIHMFILQSSKWLTPDDQWRIAAFPFSVIARPLNSTGLTKVSCIRRFYHNPSNSVTFGLIVKKKETLSFIY